MLAKTTSQRPSAIGGVVDEWAAYQFDQAVLWFGAYVENKLHEMDKIKDAKGHVRHEPRYTLKQLLDERWRDPEANAAPVRPAEELAGIQGLTIKRAKR